MHKKVRSFKNILTGNSSSIKERFVRGAFWSLLGALLGKGLVLISLIIVARILSQKEYGELGIIRSTINLFTIFAGMGIGNTAAKYIAQYRNTNLYRAVNIYRFSTRLSVAFGAIGSICLVLLSDMLATKTLNSPYLGNDIKIGALILFFTTINGIQNGALSGFEDFKCLSINNTISSIIQFATLIIFSFIWGVKGCLCALALGCMILGLLNMRAINKYIGSYHYNSNLDKHTISILWKFSLPSLLSSIMITPVLWWAKTILIRYSGYSAMAIYDVADQWSLMILFIPNALAQIVIPMLSNTLEEGSNTQYLKLVKLNLLVTFSVTTVLSLLVWILGPIILNFYGRGYIDMETLTYMLIASIFMAVCGVVGQVIASSDKMWIGFLFNSLWAFWVIIFTILFKGKGSSGLALAIMLSYTLHFIAQLIFVLISSRKFRIYQEIKMKK